MKITSNTHLPCSTTSSATGSGIVSASTGLCPNPWVRIDVRKDRIGDIGIYLNTGASEAKIPDRVPEFDVPKIVSSGHTAQARDYVAKRADYHRIGVREYVVVDRFRETMTVFSYAPDGYSERALTKDETYESPLLPGLAIPLSEVFE